MRRNIANSLFDVLPVGSRVWFSEEKKPYTVMASNVAYSVCTKPFFKTVLYTIIDWEQSERGSEGVVFECGAETIEDCQEMLERLTTGETSVSHRNHIALGIRKIQFPRA